MGWLFAPEEGIVVKGDIKDIQLEINYEEAVVKLKQALLAASKTTENELNLALRYADDTHMPVDAVRRTQKTLLNVEEKLKAVEEARRALMKYRDRH